MLYAALAPCCILLHPVAPCCNLLHPVAPCCILLHPVAPGCTLLHPVAPCCTLLHPVASCCTLLQVLDQNTGTFYAARDAIGVTCMYIGWGKDGSVWLSSEMKCLKVWNGVWEGVGWKGWCVCVGGVHRLG
jgi:hypothetical protein